MEFQLKNDELGGDLFLDNSVGSGFKNGRVFKGSHISDEDSDFNGAALQTTVSVYITLLLICSLSMKLANSFS